MKTKLLKKIRKRYSIVYYPNGKIICGLIFYDGMYVLEDREDTYRSHI